MPNLCQKLSAQIGSAKHVLPCLLCLSGDAFIAHLLEKTDIEKGKHATSFPSSIFGVGCYESY